MLKKFHISNHKSVKDLELDLGRVNVLIGENGSGKSNILEAFVLAGVTLADRPDQESMGQRGVRWVKPDLFVSAFPNASFNEKIKLSGDFGERKFDLVIEPQPDRFTKALPYEYQQVLFTPKADFETLLGKRQWPKLLDYLHGLGEEEDQFKNTISQLEESGHPDRIIAHNRTAYLNAGRKINAALYGDFGIYSPNLAALSNPTSHSFLHPFGLDGSGLLSFLRTSQNREELSSWFTSIKKRMGLLGWFRDMQVLEEYAHEKSPLEIQDRYLDTEKPIDHYSANEGFLFLLFYLTLMSIHDTPRFLAIDNIETALNPRLCTEIMKAVVELSEQMGKQVIITTHNPAVLNGLNLHDEEQRLFLIYRNDDGHTKAKRIFKPQPLAGKPATKLSQLFMDGMLGGLPDHF
jgi:AAA15 family ATPase/GTPase